MLGVVIQLLDAPRAHPHCKVRRYNVYIEAPKDLGLDPSQCLRFKRCSCVTRDAGQAFVGRDDVGVHNFSQGACSPCVFRHNTFLVLCVHGDYVELGLVQTAS